MTSDREKIYLDNAATSFPKPESVYRTMDAYMREIGASAGRGAYREAAEAERLLESVRKKILTLLGADSGRMIFTFNATDAINMALKGVLDEGDHVITTCLDHNSILRPLRAMEEAGRISVTRVPCSPAGLVDPDDIRKALRRKTRLIATLHGSNILGTLNPVREIGDVAREKGLLFLLDAAQTMGSRHVRPAETGAQMIAFPGHKGLLGPLGTGGLYFDPDLAPEPLREGGTGSRSESDFQPSDYPDRWEAGSHNLPGIAGLGAGLDYILERGLDDIHREKTRLAGLFIEKVGGIDGVRLYGPRDTASREGVFSLNVAGLDPYALGEVLDLEYGIKGRAGLHCAPLAHKAAGTFETGSFRLSLGPFSKPQHVERTAAALESLTRRSRTGSVGTQPAGG